MPSDEYERRIRELVDYCKRLSSTKTLDTSIHEESFLDVRVGPSGLIQAECQYREERTNVPSFIVSRPVERFNRISLRAWCAGSKGTGAQRQQLPSGYPPRGETVGAHCPVPNEIRPHPS